MRSVDQARLEYMAAEIADLSGKTGLAWRDQKDSAYNYLVMHVGTLDDNIAMLRGSQRG